MKLYLNDEEKEKIRNLRVLKVNQVAYFLEVSHTTVFRRTFGNEVKESEEK